MCILKQENKSTIFKTQEHNGNTSDKTDGEPAAKFLVFHVSNGQITVTESGFLE